MQYHTQKEPLILAEYGRHIQDMVNHTMSLDNRDERNKAAVGLVQVMTQLNPGYKDNEELQHKLWDDLYVMSNYKLEVDSPYPMPDRKETIVPEKIEYPDQQFSYQHYGKIIDGLILGARAIEDQEEKKALTEVIANLMKKSYLNYNRDSVNDEMLADQLKKMSEGELELDPSFRFQHTNDILSKNKKPTSSNPRSTNKPRGKRKWKK
jgi:hypothetical protein